jgi:hypothetical protein
VLVFRLLALRRHRPLTHGEFFFIGLAGFSLSSALLAGIARSGGPLPSAALASRYGALSMLYWIAAAALLWITLVANERRRYVQAIVPLVLTVVLVVSQSAYLRWWAQWRSLVEWATTSLVAGVPDREYLAYIFPADRVEIVELVTDQLVQSRASPIFRERDRYIGRSIAAFGPTRNGCTGRIVEAKRIGDGVRLEGAVVDDIAPLSHPRILVTDLGSRVIGIGAVERRWPGLRHMLDAQAALRWIAHAPLADPEQARVYVIHADGVCPLATLGGSSALPR